METHKIELDSYGPLAITYGNNIIKALQNRGHQNSVLPHNVEIPVTSQEIINVVENLVIIVEQCLDLSYNRNNR